LAPREAKKGAVNIFKRFIEGTRLPSDLAHVRWMIFLTKRERAALLAPHVRQHLAENDPYDFLRRYASQADGVDQLSRSGYVDVKSYLVDDILVKVDRMSMAVSLEVRVPFLDHRVAEFSFSLPPDLKIRGWQRKALLRQAMSDLLPEIILRRDKQGFSIPIKNWIRGQLRPMMTDLLAADRIRREGFFDAAYISRLVDEHLRSVANHSHKLWALMVFESWYQTYMENSR
jgi:asparagine synthase (glutamine-hydrolysing)